MATDDPLPGSGASLSADGHLEGRPGAAAEAPPGPEDAPLELVERGPKVFEPRVETFREPPPARPGRRRFALPALLLGLSLVGLAAAWALWPRGVQHGVREAGLAERLLGGRPPVLITSEPPGARITVGGAAVGQTPWAGDNAWLGRQEVVLTLEGYAPFRATLDGAQEVRIEARLRRR